MNMLYVVVVAVMAAHHIQALSFESKASKREGNAMFDKDIEKVSFENGVQYITALRRPDMPDGLLEGTDWQGQRSWVSPKSFRALQEHHKQVNEKRKGATPDIELMYIRDLGTEYVGQIGLGTVSQPRGCGSMKQTGPNRLLKETSCASHEQQKLDAVFDTGSTNLWMASTLCKTGSCVLGNRKRYDHQASETYKEPQIATHLDIQFGTASLKGPVGIDDFHIGPFTVQNQTFGMIEEEEGSTFADLAIEGIVGLGFPALAAKSTHPFFDNVIKQHVLKRNMFCFYLQSIDSHDSGSLLSKDGKPFNGAILWGGYDKSLFEGDIMWFRVTDPYYWAIDLYDFKIGDKSLEITASDSSSSSLEESDREFVRKHTPDPTDAPAKLIVDTGTTYYAADGALYSNIHQELRDCANSPPISYRLKDANGKMQDLVLKRDKYWVGSSSLTCELGFMKVGPSQSYGPAMMLGELFMQEYFTIFDRGDGSDTGARVGFATLSKRTPSSLIGKPGLSSASSSLEISDGGELRPLHH